MKVKHTLRVHEFCSVPILRKFKAQFPKETIEASLTEDGQAIEVFFWYDDGKVEDEKSN